MVSEPSERRQWISNKAASCTTNKQRSLHLANKLLVFYQKRFRCIGSRLPGSWVLVFARRQRLMQTCPNHLLAKNINDLTWKCWISSNKMDELGLFWLQIKHPVQAGLGDRLHTPAGRDCSLSHILTVLLCTWHLSSLLFPSGWCGHPAGSHLCAQRSEALRMVPGKYIQCLISGLLMLSLGSWKGGDGIPLTQIKYQLLSLSLRPAAATWLFWGEGICGMQRGTF